MKTLRWDACYAEVYYFSSPTSSLPFMVMDLLQVWLQVELWS